MWEYDTPAPAVARLAIQRNAQAAGRGFFADGISWDELQQIKNECGYLDAHAVELYPPHRDVVNTANVRHLWLLADAPRFAWRVAGANPTPHYYGSTEP